MEKLNKQMDDALNTKVAALNATDDETGDGKVDALALLNETMDGPVVVGESGWREKIPKREKRSYSLSPQGSRPP